MQRDSSDLPEDYSPSEDSQPAFNELAANLYSLAIEPTDDAPDDETSRYKKFKTIVDDLYRIANPKRIKTKVDINDIAYRLGQLLTPKQKLTIRNLGGGNAPTFLITDLEGNQVIFRSVGLKPQNVTAAIHAQQVALHESGDPIVTRNLFTPISIELKEDFSIIPTSTSHYIMLSEFLPDGNLRALWRKKHAAKGIKSPSYDKQYREAIQHGRALIKILKTLLDKGIALSDIKPDNILISKKGDVIYFRVSDVKSMNKLDGIGGRIDPKTGLIYVDCDANDAIFVTVTRGYHPEYFLPSNHNMPLERAYCCFIAKLIYEMAIGFFHARFEKDTRYTDETVINYKHPFFKTRLGQLVKHILRDGLLKKLDVDNEVGVEDNDIFTLDLLLELLTQDARFLIKQEKYDLSFIAGMPGSGANIKKLIAEYKGSVSAKTKQKESQSGTISKAKGAALNIFYRKRSGSGFSRGEATPEATDPPETEESDLPPRIPTVFAPSHSSPGPTPTLNFARLSQTGTATRLAPLTVRGEEQKKRHEMARKILEEQARIKHQRKNNKDKIVRSTKEPSLIKAGSQLGDEQDLEKLRTLMRNLERRHEIILLSSSSSEEDKKTRSSSSSSDACSSSEETTSDQQSDTGSAITLSLSSPAPSLFETEEQSEGSDKDVHADKATHDKNSSSEEDYGLRI